MSSKVLEQVRAQITNMTNPFETQDLIMLGTSFFIWTLMFIIFTYIPIPLKNKYCVISREKEIDIQNRAVSTIHGTILMVFSGYQFYFKYSQCGDKNT